MRLLNTRTKQFEEFFDEIPPYAILSHTWGSNELTFKHTEQNGYVPSQKIDGCCERALRDGLRYVWVDTCCIDKSSSAELSEAINSMWDWYARSQICYAYLSDVPSETDIEVDVSAFSSSRWFTRGWTLQELISPRKVQFYDEGWNCIGRKSRKIKDEKFVKLLSRVTKIDFYVLQDKSHMNSFSIAQRMRWASHRTTTRVEDMAYSLLGMFGINMPLLYGEGIRAFKRLQEEIIKISDDESIFAWGLDKTSRIEGGSLLAATPRDFENCSRIIASTPRHRKISHYTLTNKGLHVETSILELPIEGEIVLARLNCSIGDPTAPNDQQSLALVLVRSRQNDMMFTRYRGTPPVFIEETLFPASRTHIYIHRWIGHPPQHGRFNTGLWLEYKYVQYVADIIEVYPPVWLDGPFGRDFRGLAQYELPQRQNIVLLLKNKTGTGPNYVVWLYYVFTLSEGSIHTQTLVPQSLELKAAFLENHRTLAQTILESEGRIGAVLDWHETLNLGDSELSFEVIKSKGVKEPLWTVKIVFEKKETLREGETVATMSSDGDAALDSAGIDQAIGNT